MIKVESFSEGDLLDLPDERYFALKEEDEFSFEMIENNIPTIETLSGSIAWDKLYDIISKASLIPEFAESAKGVSSLLLEKSIDRITKENALVLIGGIISLNPAFGWWCVTSGGMAGANLIYVLAELGFMNPSKTIMMYTIYKKSAALYQLYRCIF